MKKTVHAAFKDEAYQGNINEYILNKKIK